MTGGLTVFSKITETKKLKMTEQKLKIIQQTLEQFSEANGYLPCPATGNVTQSNAAFGVATTYTTLLTAADLSISAADSSLNSTVTDLSGLGGGTMIAIRGFANNANNGSFHIVQSVSNTKVILAGATTLITEGAGSTITLEVRSCTGVMYETGMLPVRTLGLKDEDAFDGWERKFTYRIAQGMGAYTDYKLSNFRGDIRITDLYGREKTLIDAAPKEAAGASYVVISHGPNGTGAWYKNNTTTPASPSAASREIENTNHAFEKRYVQHTPTISFDDIVIYGQKRLALRSQKIGRAPFQLSRQTCLNARAIVDSKLAVGSESTLLGAVYNTYPTQTLQLYDTARAITLLCEKQYQPCNPTPLEVEGRFLKLWLDATNPMKEGESLPADGSVLTVWRDKSGYHYDAYSEGTTPTYTHNGINGLPVIRFDGTDSYSLLGRTLHSANQVTIFVVLKPDTVNTRQSIFSTRINSDTNSFQFEYGAGSGAGTGRTMISTPTTNYVESADNTLKVDGFYVLTLRRGGTALSLSKNGSVTAELLAGAPTFATNTSDKMIGVGQSKNTHFMVGDIGEFILYESALNATQRQSIENYLIQKWFQKSCY